MKIKHFIIAAMIITPLFAAGCSDSNKESASVKVDLSGASIFESLSAIQGITQSDSSASVIPSSVDKIVITITQGTAVLYKHTFSREAISNASDTITLDLPASTGLVFTITCYNIGGIVVYSGTSGTVDIIAGSEITVPITLHPEVYSSDALITLNLKEQTSSSDFSYKSYYSTMVADVYSVSATTENGETTVTTQSVNNSTAAAVTDPVTTVITGLKAYPNTFQLIIVKVFATDGTLAAIGAAIKTNLVSGDNGSIDIRMFPPGRLNITNSTPNTPYTVEIYYGSSFRQVATGITDNNGAALVLVPNSRTDIGKYNGTTVDTKKHDIQVTVGVTTRSKNYAVNWKQVNLDFNSDIWSEQTSN